MASTYFEYLTLPNPVLNASQCKGGVSTRTVKNLGPHDVREWPDMTFANLIATFEHVLRQQMDAPKVENARDISPDRTILYEEDSMTVLAERWNESVVNHALKGTQDIIRRMQPGGPMIRGRLRFTKNAGQVKLKNEKPERNEHPVKPDWCVQEIQNRGKPINLVLGDTKPASKWKSEWINSEDEVLKHKGRKSLKQVTKYLYLGKTRYGFLLTDEELVPVRLSKSFRNLEAEKQLKKMEYQKAQMADWAEDFRSQGHGSFKTVSTITTVSSFGTQSDARSDDSYADSQRLLDVVLEYRCIPWSRNGRDDLTVNLALWWLSTLAAHSHAIKESGTYTSLGEKARGKSPAFEVLEPEGREYKVNPHNEASNSRKRTRDEFEAAEESTRRSNRKSSRWESAGNPSHSAQSSFTSSVATGAAATASRPDSRGRRTLRPRRSRQIVDDVEPLNLGNSSSQSMEAIHFSFSA